MAEVFLSAFPCEDHARTMLRVVLDAGIAARLVRTIDLSADELPDCCRRDPREYCCVMFMPEDQREWAEIATHRNYGLCRWCGRQLKGTRTGECPVCGTPSDGLRTPPAA
jgi:hypothetical protein